ncbi:hypothetical protein [Clostridium botulinum]
MNFYKYNSMQDKPDLVKSLNKLIDALIFKIRIEKSILSNLALLSSEKYF